jgi:hypothetical protein
MPDSQTKYGPQTKSSDCFNSQPKRTFGPLNPDDNKTAQTIADARKKVGQCSQTEGYSDEYEPNDND